MKTIMLNAIAFLCLCIATYLPPAQAFGNSHERQHKPGQELSLREGLSRITQVFGVKFTYERTIVEKIKVYYDWDNMKSRPIKEVLDATLGASGLSYKMVDKNYYIITGKKVALTVRENAGKAIQLSSADGSALEGTDTVPATAGRTMVPFTGHVTEKGTGKPIESATVNLVQYGLFTTTDAKGAFSFKEVPAGKARLVVNYVSMVAYNEEIDIRPGRQNSANVQLEANVLSLKNVEVVATENRAGGPTTSTISRKAIEHLQATSLADVMQLLPGGITVNPDFSGVNRFAIRQIPREGDNLGNLGTGIIINGAPVSNNGNLQTTSTSAAGANASFSTSTGGGVDLRSITADNIESIEVIRGVPSVEYGDITSGAIIVKTKAGVEPFNIKARINPKITQFYMGKGAALGAKGGNLNVDLDYTRAMDDQRNRSNSYNRITANVLYSKKFFNERPLFTTTGFTYGMNLDDEKEDPDDKRDQRSTKAQNYNYRFTTSGKWSLQRKFARTLNYAVSVDYSVQKGYQQELLSGFIYPLSYSKEDITQPGQFVPSEYVSKLWVDGKPLSIFAKITNSFFGKTGNIHHRILMGGEWRTDVNNGNGRTYDLSRPPRIGTITGSAFRPRSYKDIPALNQLSLYLEDNLYTTIADRKLSLQAGLRFDNVQPEGIWNSKVGMAVSPRANLSYELSRNFSLHFGYGITAKAPTLLYLYPDRAYFDLLNFNYFSADPAERLVIITTRVFNTENPDLKISKNHKKEIGFDWNFSRGKRLTVTAFYERNKNDYLFATNFNSVRMVPVAKFDTLYTRPGQPPVLNETPAAIDTFIAAFNTPTNNSIRTNKGIEFDLDLGRFEAIRTSFVFNGAWISSANTSQGYTITKKLMRNGMDPQQVGIFAPGSGAEYEVNERISTTLRLIHHIPQLRFIVTFSAQTIWRETNKKTGLDSLPIGYIRRDNSQIVWLNKAEREQIAINKQEELIARYTTELYRTESWNPLWMFNLRLTKEIGKNMGFSFFANNVFMHRPLQASNRYINRFERRGQAFFFGTELNFKF